MKLTKSINNNLWFPFLWKTYSLLLLLVGFSYQSFGQIHIGKNATLSIQEGTVFHISENNENQLQTAKIYVEENAKIINFSTDSIAEIVYVKKEKQTKKTKDATLQNKSEKYSQPPMVKKDTESEKKSVLSFVPKQTPPSSLFYSGKTTKAALIQNINLGTKFFPLKKSYNSIVHSFLLNNDPQISISSNEFLLRQQADLEGYITRPPPFQVRKSFPA